VSSAVTGDASVSPSRSQQRLLQPQQPRCAALTANGTPCGFPPPAGAVLCQRHDPDQAEVRRAHNRLAAHASHIRRVTPEMETWAESLDFTTEDGRARSLTEVAQLVAKEALTPGQGNAIAALARAAAGGKTPKPAPSAPLIVEVAKYGNGHQEPAS
jgi:hypothetical protein